MGDRLDQLLRLAFLSKTARRFITAFSARNDEFGNDLVWTLTWSPSSDNSPGDPLDILGEVKHGSGEKNANVLVG